jgi:hypothetical protein
MGQKKFPYVVFPEGKQRGSTLVEAMEIFVT